MNLKLGWCTLAMLGLVACGGNKSGTVEVTDDPVAMRSAPAGTATLAFLDLQTSLRPDALPAAVALPPSETAFGLVAASALPGCIQPSTAGNVTTYTYTNCKAANSGTLNGTVTVTLAPPAGGTTVYTEVFNLTSALDATRSWHYTGTQTITITGSTATVTSVPASAINVAFTDSLTPANSKTYVFTPAITMNWSVAGRFVMDGSYSFTRAGAETISVHVTPADPLTWTTGCDYPTSGTLALSLTGAVTGSASTTAVFGPACGRVAISGGVLNLGSH